MVTKLSKMYISNCTQALIADATVIQSISNSEFINNGVEELKYGGAMYLLNSKASIQESIFTNNSAIIGGGIAFVCTSMIQ